MTMKTFHSISSDFKIRRPSFVVVMSTFNGEKYLNEQIESIINQKGVDIQLVVRDDGSSDNTVDILNYYKNINKLKWYSGENLKPAKSFLNLLMFVKKNIPEDSYDYIALSDQDDIWYGNKLLNTASALANGYDLYFCSMEAFTQGFSERVKIIKADTLSFGEIMFRNNTAGCSMSFNKKVLNIINKYSPQYIEMHDSWILRVCNALKFSVFADQKVLMRYRIHERNACGTSITLIERIRNHFKNLVYHDLRVSSMTAHELLTGYSSIMDSSYLDFLTVLDKSTHSDKRKIKLLRYIINMKFSTWSRKIDCMIEVISGKI